MFSKKFNDNALHYGNKAANLQELITIASQPETSTLNVGVPELLCLKHDVILAHLDKYATKKCSGSQTKDRCYIYSNWYCGGFLF